ncbi:hypothetical protein K435DRAFT_871319 [Dendrothele bispora CBS 962.96]|uniref:Uncharacterized protein n=1 Tax=Dendrothele bispora (strain CBS 962.96) TaxID=1314807 RepID=A0A4S8L4Z6_DENBC|nr:hypothetical protein K435DRAFT_871319 [Dendrothele bispora CBS 962.96]
MPRGTTRGRSAGNAARGSVRGGASHGRGTFTSARIPTPPTSDGLILETQSRVRQQERITLASESKDDKALGPPY